MKDSITLIDGSILECYPAAIPSDEIVSGGLSLDTSGEYLTVGKKAHFVPDKELKGRRKQEQMDAKMFYEHTHLFLANAERILSDSRLFLASVHVANGLAYTGTSGFQKPTLGVYIEWWLYHKEASIDAKGRPIWFISGSPLSGSNACSAVDRKGKTHRAELNGSFSSVWSSFTKVNNRYNEAKGRYMAYNLSEAIEILEGEADPGQMFRLHLRLEQVKYENCIANLKHVLKQTNDLAAGYKDKIQQLLFTQHAEGAKAYYDKCRQLQAAAQEAHESYLQQRIELRKQLRGGIIDNITYQNAMAPLKKRADEAKLEQSMYERDGLEVVFGADAAYFRYADIERLLTAKEGEN